ncbi:hypothetical protein ACFZDG_12425 [Kitasatospora xanthocidica]|uniref:hypothetical protein n=1 Tax=Kitasatospora xanthocidica TaxID=83382 RepID=UPI0036E886A9
MADTASQRLLSYGTLQLDQVQLSSLGRLLEGRPDALPGFRLTMIEISDPDVIAAGGTDRHPLVPASDEAGDA